VSVQLSDGVAPVEDRVFRLGIVATGRHAGRIAIAASPLFHNRVKEIPGALYSKLDGCWTVPLSWPAVLTIGEVARGLKVGIRPTAELVAWVTKYKNGWAELRALSADLGGGKAMPAPGELYGHQGAGARWLIGPGDGRFPTAGRLLLDDTGTGKTITVIEALKSLDRWPVLITCPKSVIRVGWQAAFETWLPHVRVVVADGSAAKRRKAIDLVRAGEADVLLIGHESFRTHTRYSAFPGHALKRCAAHGGPKTGEDVVPEARCQAHPRELNEIDWAVIVCDEIHKGINPTAQLTQALWGVVDGAPDTVLRWGLTGTLISKRTDQAWAPLRYADHNAWPVKSAWVDYYLEQGFDQHGFWQVVGLNPQRKDEFIATFDGITRRVLKDQVLDLPPVLRGGSLIREVTLGREQRAVYDDMRTKMIAWVEEGKITASNALVQAGRMTLLSSATGYPILDDEGGISEMGLKLPSAKLAQFLEDLDDELFGDSQIGMLFESRKFLRLVEKAMLDHGVLEDDIGVIAGDVSLDRRTEVIDAFQAGRKRFCLLTYAAGGTGITLTAADQVVLMQRSWSPILMKQGLDRFIRIGAEKHESITVFDYLAADTIEQRQIDRLGHDAATYEDLVRDRDRLRALFEV